MRIQRVKKFLILVRDVWLIVGIAMLILIAGNYSLEFLSDLFDRRAKSPVYENFPDYKNFWKEQKNAKARFEPYYHWRRDAYSGKYTNISEDGVRLTPNSGIRPDAKQVFMFGGSTMWGTGSPDNQTIPSYLQAQIGDAAQVHNFGESGYVSAQELNLLLHLLSTGNIPDVVIFYDGVNDGYAGAYSPAVPRDPQNLRQRRSMDTRNVFIRAAFMLYESSNYRRLRNYLRLRSPFDSAPRDSWGEQIDKDIKTNSELVLDMYEAHIRQVQALAREYKFRVLFYWQPHLFSLTRENNSYEESLIDTSSSTLVDSQQEVYTVARKRLLNRENEDIFFLGNIFDDFNEPIYIDWNHVGPTGNKIIAAEMFRAIESSF